MGPGIMELLLAIPLYVVAVTTMALGVALGIRWGLKWMLKDISRDPEIEECLKRIFKQSEK